jgi:hypothetical protein
VGKAARLRAQKARQQPDPRTRPWSFPRPGERIEVAFIPGLVLDVPGEVDSMKQRTHDGLLDMLGTRRRSGIRWAVIHGRAESERWLRSAYGESAEDWALAEQHFIPFLAEYGDRSVLIVAHCDAAVPGGA